MGSPAEICGNCKFFDPNRIDGEPVGDKKGLCRSAMGLAIGMRGEISNCGFETPKFSPKEGVVFESPETSPQAMPAEPSVV